MSSSTVLLIFCVAIATGIQLYHVDLQKAADDFGVNIKTLDLQSLPGKVVDLCGYITADLNKDGHLSAIECISAIAKITTIILSGKMALAYMLSKISKRIKMVLRIVLCFVIVIGIQIFHLDLQKAADDKGVYNINLNLESLPPKVTDLCSYITIDLNEDGQLSTIECIPAIAKITAVVLCGKLVLRRLFFRAVKKIKKLSKSKKKKDARVILLAGCIVVFVIAQFPWVPAQLSDAFVPRCVHIDYTCICRSFNCTHISPGRRWHSYQTPHGHGLTRMATKTYLFWR